MALLFDLFGYLTVVLDGLFMVTLAFTVGGIAFLVLLARPLAGLLGDTGRDILRRSRFILTASALGLALAVAGRTALDVMVLAGTTDLTLAGIAGATFVRAGVVIGGAALLAAAVAITRFDERRPLLLPLVVCLILGAASLLTHGAARLEDRWQLIALVIVHLAAVAVWIGGLPYFLTALAFSKDHVASHRIGARFSLMAMAAVFALAASGLGIAYHYIDSAAALYGTAYGAMLTTKVLMFLVLLGFGFKNMLIVRQLRRSPDAPLLVMRRFAEVELGVGIAVFLCAASLTSLPPAVDLKQDRVTWDQLVERMTPEVPRLTSPDHDTLAIPQLEARLAAAREAGATGSLPTAYVPGAGVIVPPTAADLAWSEYNHHWAGILVLAIGLLALLERSGFVPLARHWPLLFLALAAFVIVRSDPEGWPLGSLGFMETLRDPEVMQHRLFALLVIGFGLFEWGVRTGFLAAKGLALVFPLLVAAGGTLMLAHSHSLGNIRQELLVEWTHIPIALLGIAGGWARWLELRLPPPRGRLAAWLWPLTFVLIGAILLNYRES
jgi:putative copper resistance protein D